MLFGLTVTAQSTHELPDRYFIMKVASTLGDDNAESSTLNYREGAAKVEVRVAALRDVLRRPNGNA